MRKQTEIQNFLTKNNEFVIFPNHSYLDWRFISIEIHFNTVSANPKLSGYGYKIQNISMSIWWWLLMTAAKIYYPQFPRNTCFM